jgi:hypothetical protein
MRASEYNIKYISQFRKILVEAEEVDPIAFKGLLEKNPILSFYPNTENIGAIGALKIPNRNYRSGVFKKAKSSLNPIDYPFELGWIVSVTKNSGYGKRITQLLSNYPSNIYATVREENKIMIKILTQCNYTKSGVPFLSSRGNYNICLYVKNDASQQFI